MDDKRLIEIEQIARKYGCANCWTGSSAELTHALFDAVQEIKRLRRIFEIYDELKIEAHNSGGLVSSV